MIQAAQIIMEVVEVQVEMEEDRTVLLRKKKKNVGQ
jgi:hypothetical protein